MPILASKVSNWASRVPNFVAKLGQVTVGWRPSVLTFGLWRRFAFSSVSPATVLKAFSFFLRKIGTVAFVVVLSALVTFDLVTSATFLGLW